MLDVRQIPSHRFSAVGLRSVGELYAGFPSNAAYATHARKLRNKRNERKERSWRGGRNGCPNKYPQPPPLLGRLLLQFNAAQQNEL